jgi:hypothetical protein
MAHFDERYLDELRAALPVLDVVKRRHEMRKEGGEYRAIDNHSLTVNPNKNIWNDFGANGGGGDIFAFWMHETHCSFPEAVTELARMAGMALPSDGRRASPTSPPPPPHDVQRAAGKREIVATYDYEDADGGLVYQVVRYEPKGFNQRRPLPGEPGKWIWGLRAGRYIRGRNGDFSQATLQLLAQWRGAEQREFEECAHGLYRFPRLREELAEDPSEQLTIFLPEGEKDCDTLAAWGLVTTTNSGGARNWRADHAEHLRGADVVVLLDNDKGGRERGQTIAASLHKVAKRVRVLDWRHHWPECPDKGDVTQWRDEAGGTLARLFEIIERLPDWSPEVSPAGASEAPADDYAIWTEEEIARAFAEERDPLPPGSSSKTGRQDTLRLVFFSQLAEEPPNKGWLTKNVIARGETSSWIAPPGGSKSALLADLAVHVANGADWRGYRAKGRHGVVYFALERADLVKRRLVAYRRRDQLPGDLPIAVTSQVLDLMNRDCVDTILAAIAQAEQHFGCKVGLIIIDTYAKGIAAGAGDEDRAKDQNIVLANLRRVIDRAPVHIAGIGHTGKIESKGERGSNARLADVDVLVQITGEAIKTATVMKGNDQPEGVLTSFRLEPFEFGVDEDGDPFRTFIVSKENLTGTQAERALSDRQRNALAALTEAVLSRGRDAPAEYSLPHGIKVVTAEEWKTELLRENVIDGDSTNPRARFNELRTALKAKHLIGSRDDLVWSAQRTPPP